jgi:omega-amidase
MSDLLKVAILQFNTEWHDIEQNLRTIDSLLDQLTTPVDLILLPEMFATGFTMQPELFTEKDNLRILEWMRKTAKSHIALVLGTHPWKINENYYNRMICAGPDDEIDHYDKRHLFSIGGENIHYKHGNERKTFLVKGWNIFPVICYDIRFPVWCRNNLSYDLLINLTNWPSVRDYAWDILLRARAIENQCYVVGVNRLGTDDNNIQYTGNSRAISMRGEIIKQCSNEDRIACVDLNLSELREFRVKFPFLPDQDSFSIT